MRRSGVCLVNTLVCFCLNLVYIPALFLSLTLSRIPQTGLTDLPLTDHGVDVISSLGKRIVGPGKILDPTHIKHAFVSPRQRAQKTYNLLFDSIPESERPEKTDEDGVREWDYGVCEGKTTKEIRGELGETWDIWTDGCPEGESAQEMSDRCDRMIEKIVDVTKYALLLARFASPFLRVTIVR